MLTSGLVSIISPSYNCGKYISKTIDSVLEQTYKEWEMIIVDDCSTDDTESIVASYVAVDSRIRYFRNETNCGAAVSRNRALKEAKGRWIAFLDCDDLWLPDTLEAQISFMLLNGVSFSYTDYFEINEAGNKTGIIVSGPQRITRLGMNLFCWPGCLTVIYDSSIVGLIQIEDIKKNNDYALWLKVIKHADCFLLDRVLAMYRRGRMGSISTHGLFSLIKWHYYLFRRAEHRTVFYSVFFTSLNLFFGFIKKIKYYNRV